MENSQKLSHTELKTMQILWDKGALPAKEVSLEAAARYGWNKNTTYTILKHLVEKGHVQREEPGFLCRPLTGRQQIQRSETRGLIDRLFEGSPVSFFSAFFENEDLSPEQLEEIRKLIDNH